jgi:hypothetical protein
MLGVLAILVEIAEMVVPAAMELMEVFPEELVEPVAQAFLAVVLYLDQSAVLLAQAVGAGGL